MCGANTQLSDGRILFVGGGGNFPVNAHGEAHAFTPDGLPGDEWSDVDAIPDEGDDDDERWYATATTTWNGKVVVIAGRQSCSDSPVVLQDRPLIFDPQAPSLSRWTRFPASEAKVVHWYPFVFQVSDQTVLMAGGAYFDPNGPAAIHLDSFLLHPVMQAWIPNAIARAARPGGSAVMYRPDKVMKAGGTTGCSNVPATDGVERLEVVLGAASGWEDGPAMGWARTHFYLIVLADGRVMAVGGLDENGDAVLTAEWIDPEKKPWPAWQPLADMVRSRGDHASAVLCPDARIFIAGEGEFGGGDTEHSNGQFFQPPYLFDASGAFIEDSNDRPVIDESQTPDTIAYQSVFYVYLDTGYPHDVGSDWKVSLVRLGASTHGFDQNQRFQWLNFIAQPEHDRLRVGAPVHGAVAPPGYYMLFVLRPGDRAGIWFPSRARIVKVQ